MNKNNQECNPWALAIIVIVILCMIKGYFWPESRLYNDEYLKAYDRSHQYQDKHVYYGDD